MPSEQLFNKFADIPALEKEKAQVREIFGEIKSSIIELSGLGLKLDTTKGMNEIVKLQQQVGQLNDKLLSSQNKLAESEARLEKIRAQSALTQEKADLIRTKNIVAQNKELDRQIALEEKKSKISKEPKAQDIGNLTPQRAAYIESVPFINKSLEADTAAAEKATTVVNELEIAEAQLANESVALNTSLAEQGVIMSEVGAETDSIVLKYDEFTGSMAENIRVQYENVAAIEANKKEQTALLATIKEQGFATDQQVAQFAQLKEESSLIIATNKELTSTIRLQAQAFNAEQGSIAEMAAQLELLQRSYSKLGTAEKGSAFGQRLKGEIDLLDPALKKAEEGIGKTGRQVGSYSNAITKSLGGAFGFLRQIAYIIPGLGVAGLISAIIDPVLDLTKSMFKLGDGIDRDTSAFGLMKQNLAQFNEEVKKGSQNLEEYFKWLDQIRDASKVNLKIDEINVNPIQKLRTELTGLQLDVSNTQTKYLEAEKEFDKVARDAGELQNAFLNNASKDAVQAYYNGTIESLKDGLNKTDKVLYQGLLDANDAYTKSSERLTATFNARNAAVQRVNEQVKTIAKQTADDARQIERDSAIAAENIIKGKNDAILANERSSYSERLKALKSNYAAENAIISANEKFVLSDPTKSDADKNAAIKTAQVDFQKNQIAFAQNQYKLNEEFRLRDAKATHDYYESLIKDDETFQRKLIENTIGSIETRSEALESFTKDQLELAKQNYELQLQQSGFSKKEADEFISTGKYQIEGKKVTNAELIQIQRAYESEILSITRSAEEENTKIVIEEIEKQNQLRQESVNDIERIYANRSVSGVGSYADEVIALNKANRDKLISDEQYDKKRRQIDRKYQQDTLSNLIDQIEEELTVYDGSNQRLLGAQIKLNQDREKLRKLEASKVNQYLIDRLEKEIAVDQAEVNSAKAAVDERIKLLEKLKNAQKDLSDSQTQGTQDDNKNNKEKSLTILEGASGIGSGVTDLSDALHDRKLQQYEDQKKALEDRYNTEVEYINKVYANSVDKQQKLDEANKRYAQQKAILDGKEREEQLRKARFDKANSIFQIIIGTAAAIIRDLGNPLKIAFDATLGAIQLAVATAAPLPTYAKGTNYSNAGKALVGEAGRELGVEPSGRVILWDKPTIANLVAGTKIFPNRVTEDIIASNHNLIYSLKNNNVEVKVHGKDDEILDELKQLNSKPPLVIVNRAPIETTAYYQQQIKW